MAAVVYSEGLPYKRLEAGELHTRYVAHGYSNVPWQ